MRANMQIANPGDIPVTAEITMRLSEWKKLREVLPSEHPYYDLSRAIRSMVHDAETTFYPPTIDGE